MIVKIVGAALGAMFLLVLAAVFTSLFVLAGWNWGVVAAIPGVNAISLFEAFFLALFVSAISGTVKGIQVHMKD